MGSRPSFNLRFNPPFRQLLLGGRAQLRPFEEIVDQLGARVAHFHIERFNAVAEVVEHPDGRDSHEQTDGGGDQGFGNTAGDRARPVDFEVEIALNAFMMPTTVPNSPTNGAVEPMVARLLTPRFSSAWTIASARSSARREASISSPGISALI